MPLDSIFNQLDTQRLLLVLMLIVFPGLVAMRIYRLFAPAKDMDWQNAVYESSFWGTVNILFASIFGGIIVYITNTLSYLRWEFLFVFFVLTAICLPIIWIRIRRLQFIRQKIINPCPTAWDHYFSQRKPCFVLVHLKNGQLIGGYYGENSLASSYPEKVSIYLEKILHVDENGVFGDYIVNSDGAVLDSDVFDYIEVFDIPTIKEKPNDKSKRTKNA